MKPSYQLSKKKVLNAVKFGAAEHMKKGTIRQVPAWAWGGEQEIIALAETFGVVIMVHCSRNGTVQGTPPQMRFPNFEFEFKSKIQIFDQVENLNLP